MTFRSHPILYVYGIGGVISFIIGALLFGGLLFVKETTESALTVIVFVLFFSGDLLALYVIFYERKLFFGKVVIEKTGITEKCFAMRDRKLPWDKIEDCGILKASKSGVDNIWCIYFSEERVTQYQKLGKVPYGSSKMHPDTVRIPFCEDAIEAVEKYAPERVAQRLKTDPLFPQ